MILRNFLYNIFLILSLEKASASYIDIMKLIKWIVGNQTLIDRIWDMNSLIHDTIMVRQDLSFFEYLLIDGYTNSLWHIQNVGATSYDFSYRVRDFAPHYNFCRHIKLQKTYLVIAKVLPLEILQFCLFAFEDVFQLAVLWKMKLNVS